MSEDLEWFLMGKTREIMRQRQGLITQEKARELAEVKYLPGYIRSKQQQYLKENDFDNYLLVERLFFNKDPEIRKAAAKELKERIAAMESPD